MLSVSVLLLFNCFDLLGSSPVLAIRLANFSLGSGNVGQPLSFRSTPIDKMVCIVTRVLKFSGALAPLIGRLTLPILISRMQVGVADNGPSLVPRRPRYTDCQWRRRLGAYG